MRRKLEGSVVAITGASSGIGRATALAFARRGASLVLVARRDRHLIQVGEECERLGADVLVVPVDVAHEPEVREVVTATLETFGHLDVWVNNAAVSAFGFFEATPPEVFRQIIETDFFGYVYGARAVLPAFHQQGRGVLINVASLASRISQPYASAYVAAKHGIDGFMSSLRQELRLQGADDIHVCTVMPAAIDTPFFQHAGNYAGRAAKAMPPVYPPERVAETIVQLAIRPRREVFVGGSARVLSFLSKIAPPLAERLFARATEQGHLYRTVPAAATAGNVFEPSKQVAVHGGWKARGGQRLLRNAAIGATALAGWALLRKRGSALGR